MNSATSTDTLQPWQLFTLAGLIGATVVVFVSRGQTPAGIILLSLTIFAAAVVGLAAWRTFSPLSSDEDGSGPQILGGRTRAALEREPGNQDLARTYIDYRQRQIELLRRVNRAASRV